MRNMVVISAAPPYCYLMDLLTHSTGDIVRFGPNKLSFRTTGALHDIYTDRRANMIKTGWTYAGLRINVGYTTHTISDRQLHAARRRLLNNAFAEGALKNLEKYVLERIRDWCDYISEPQEIPPQQQDEKSSPGWGKERDMGIWSTLLTVDVLGELCFGSNFGAMKDGYSYIMDLLISSAVFQTKVRHPTLLVQNATQLNPHPSGLLPSDPRTPVPALETRAITPHRQSIGQQGDPPKSAIPQGRRLVR